jgi:hypothetical protein
MKNGPAHLGEAARVVRHGTVRVGGKRDAEGGEHADSGDRDAVEGSAAVAQDDGDDDGEARHDARDHADAEALDDDGSGRHEALLRD